MQNFPKTLIYIEFKQEKAGEISMVDIRVNSNICDHRHEIHGEKNGKEISIDVKTGCPKIRELSHLDVPMMQLFDIRDNYVIGKAKDAKVCATCIVPSGILHACSLEAGFISKKLAKKAKNISIEFGDGEE